MNSSDRAATLKLLEGERVNNRIYDFGATETTIEVVLRPSHLAKLRDFTMLDLHGDRHRLQMELEQLQKQVKSKKARLEEVNGLLDTLGENLPAYRGLVPLVHADEWLAEDHELPAPAEFLFQGRLVGSVWLDSVWVLDESGRPIVESFQAMSAAQRDAIHERHARLMNERQLAMPWRPAEEKPLLKWDVKGPEELAAEAAAGAGETGGVDGFAATVDAAVASDTAGTSDDGEPVEAPPFGDADPAGGAEPGLRIVLPDGVSGAITRKKRGVANG